MTLQRKSVFAIATMSALLAGCATNGSYYGSQPSQPQ